MRTMVHYSTSKDTVILRTYSPGHKKSDRFILLRSEIEQARSNHITIKDIGNFAELRVSKDRNGQEFLRIDFTWISEVNMWGRGTAQMEHIRVPLERIEPVNAEGKLLSAEPSMPDIVFSSRENLAAVAANPYVRRQLSKYLRTAFSWPDTSLVCLRDDFAPYSFWFDSWNTFGGRGMFGALIYNENDDGSGHYELNT